MLGNRSKRYEVEKDTPVLNLELAKVPKDHLGFGTGNPISGLDETITEYTKEDMKPLLAWDSGESGLSVKATRERDAGCPKQLSAGLEGSLYHEVFKGYTSGSRDD
ncbi:MAG: hypothetical protein JSV00_00395 [bacterium]|nr:MAG: hypothetical protein JSV00_00395 [bacterium]